MKRHGKSQSTMDRFLVRSPRVSPASSPTKNTGVLRQATLENLKGVVVVEEMERAKVVLERNDVSTELKVDTLQRLLCKNPAKEVLIRTNLGKTVHKLCRAKEEEVATVAQQVYASWKKHILSKVNRPYIEVKCDLKTQKLRASAKRMLTEVLQREDEEGEAHKNREGNNKEEGSKRNNNNHTHLERKETKQSLHKPKHEQKEEGAEKKSTTSKRPRRDSDTKDDTHESKQKRKDKSEVKDRGHTTHKKTKKDSDMEEYIHNTKLEQEGEEKEKGKSESTREHNEPSQESDTQHDSLEMLAEHLEQKVYHSLDRRVHHSYRRTIRSMVFALRHQRDIRKAVTSATLSVQDFIKLHIKS